MMKIHAGNVFLAGAILFGLSLANAVSAADVDKLVEPCFSCHGENGNSADANVPNIASYSAEYMAKSLQRYQKKERPCVETEYRSGGKKGQKADMCKIAEGLSEQDIGQIGEFFAEQTFERAPQKFDEALVKKGRSVHKRQCETCHGEGGTLPYDHAGILGGQKMSYLREQLKLFKEGKRPMSAKMKPKLEALSDADAEAVVNYYGSFQ